MEKHGGKKPITIVTGCLGSGKTTLLQRVLGNKKSGEKVAVIVNEFGKEGLDHHLLRQAEERTVLLNGGCICCNSREDLENELKELLSKEESGEAPFERVVIETTGMADPAPILFTILTNPLLQHRYVMDCIITTVDTKNGSLQIKRNPELLKQVAAADKVVLTKTDLASETEIADVASFIQETNPSCAIYSSQNVQFNTSFLENSGHHRIRTVSNTLSNQNHYPTSIQSISFSVNSQIDWTAFGLWLSMLLYAKGEDVLRVKGLLDTGEKGPIVLNGVQHIIHPPQHLNEWPADEKKAYLVFILRDIDPQAIKDSLKTFQLFLGTSIDLLNLETVI